MLVSCKNLLRWWTNSELQICILLSAANLHSEH